MLPIPERTSQPTQAFRKVMGFQPQAPLPVADPAPLPGLHLPPRPLQQGRVPSLPGLIRISEQITRMLSLAPGPQGQPTE